jgi:alpha-glucosidase
LKLGNHDNHRTASRYGIEKADLLNILLQTLPGAAITYQGEELALEDVHLTWEETVDPAACLNDREHYHENSRDPARTVNIILKLNSSFKINLTKFQPFPWDDSKMAGFTTGDKTWLAVGTNYLKNNVKAQENAENSHLKIFRKLTKIRKTPAFKTGNYSGILSNNKNVYSYIRRSDEELGVVVLNFGDSAQIVNLRSLFKDVVPDKMKIYVSSLESGLSDG